MTITTEDLTAVAAWAEKRAAWFANERDVQLSIDPHWTEVEVKPPFLDDTIKGLTDMAHILRELVDQQKEPW